MNFTHHIASVSFGKDSLAMLLMLIEKQYPLDEVMFYDTGMEFNAIYNLISIGQNVFLRTYNMFGLHLKIHFYMIC